MRWRSSMRTRGVSMARTAWAPQLCTTPPGREHVHTPLARRQYGIRLRGHAELVLSCGQTIQVGPGSIELAEDLTGKGHITRTIGNEDRIAIIIPVSGS